MNTNQRQKFGKYVETLRKSRGKSLRETAKALKVSPQYYSEVEKGRSSTFTAEKLKLLACFLLLNDEEAHTLYDAAAESRSSRDVATPQDCADYLYAERGTMLIHNTVLNDWNEYRLRSTIGHECGHWLFHSDYYLNADNISYRGNVSESEIKGCRKADIESSTEQAAKRKFKTDFDWLEHHAKYFSAAILMPKTPFINTVLDLRGNSYHDDANLAESLSKIFLVSSSSAKIRLAQLGLHACLSDEEKIQDTL